MATLVPLKAEALRPIRDIVFVTDLDIGARKTSGGIILADDDMKVWGIRDRWAKVFSVGPDVKDLKSGDWILLSHGRWTQGFDIELDGSDVRLWRVEYPEGVLLVSDADPREQRYQVA
jgi:co-chaperonin GroES (HSP10)